MMLELLQKIFLNYMTELLVGILLFMGVLPRRKSFALRAVLGLIAADIIAYFLDTTLTYPNIILGSFTFLLCFVILGIPYVWLCCKATWQEAVLCAVCGYAAQHFASSCHILVRGALLFGTGKWVTLDYIPVYLVCYGLFYLLFAKPMKEIGRFSIDTNRSILAVIAILPVVLFLSITAKQIMATEGGVALFYLCQVYAMVCCFYAMWMQVGQQRSLKIQQELNLKESVWSAQKNKFQTSKETINLINHKCHDLKHQIAALRQMENNQEREVYLKGIEDAVEIYDSDLQTGNEALDTVLAEKSLYCRHNNINLLCVADGALLDFINVIDLYTMFGNALDNAIEAVSQVQENEKRNISVKVYRQNKFLMIQTENFYANAPMMANGLPVTSKVQDGYHGFGVKSILYTAEKYDGCITVHTQNGVFYLQILIPLPEETEA
jgi:hypothetical protein